MAGGSAAFLALHVTNSLQGCQGCAAQPMQAGRVVRPHAFASSSPQTACKCVFCPPLLLARTVLASCPVLAKLDSQLLHCLSRLCSECITQCLPSCALVMCHLLLAGVCCAHDDPQLAAAATLVCRCSGGSCSVVSASVCMH